MKQINVLNEKQFNKVENQIKLENAFKELEQNIKSIKLKAEKKRIYVDINETQEKEKLINKLFPFMRNSNRNINVYNIQDSINEIEFNFYRRFETALREIGFISVNEKNKTVKCKPSFSLLSLYQLLRIAEFTTNDNNNDIDHEVIKEYANGSKEFKFKHPENFDLFLNIVYWSNDKTQYVINNAPKELIKKYKETKKIKYKNECYLITEWYSTQGFKRNLKPFNWNLINKAWRV